MHVAEAKRGKMRVSKLRLVLVLLLLGSRVARDFLATESESVVIIQNGSNCEITFATQLKNILSNHNGKNYIQGI